MQKLFLRYVELGLLFALVSPTLMRAESDPSTIYKTNCLLCHSADGGGNSATGKALHAKDLRSDEVQKQDDATLAAAITNGKGKMPSFGAKIRPDDVTKLVAYIRELSKGK